jgi:hypothetical protein
VTTAFDVVLKDLDERREYIANALVSGAAKEFSEYKHMCGEIQGLTFAHTLITDLVRKMENDE